MKLVIDGSMSASGSSLHLKVAGFSIEVSDISSSGKVAVIEDSGRIYVEVVPFCEISEPLVEEIYQEEQNEPEKEVLSKVVEISPDILFHRLVALRRDIAKEVKMPPYIIFHDSSLKDMVSKLPTDLEEMKDISGVGQSKLEKYGTRFIDIIKEYLAEVA
jgi:ATP-dependent DNA helicase RecQ